MGAHSGLIHDGAVPQGIMHPVSRSLFAYWNQLRGELSAPSRQEIDLHAIAPILPWIGVVERAGAGRRYRWRLAGTGIARLWGNDPTGSEVATGWPEVYRRQLVRALDGVCERRQPFVARLRATSVHGEELGLELVAVPVQACDGASVQSFCTMVPFREPSWLGRVGLVDVELTTIIAIWTDRLPDQIKDVRTFKLIQGGRSD